MTTRRYASLTELPAVLWCLALLTAPFPTSPAGLPQLNDFLMLSSMLTFVVYERGQLAWPRETSGFVTFLGAFAGYTLVLSAYWSLASGSGRPSVAGVFHTFNVGMALGVLAMFRRYGPKLIWTISTITALGLVAELVVGWLFFRTHGSRQALAFANPNSLAMFAVTGCATFFAVPSKPARPIWIEAGVLVVTALLILLSASRGSVLALIPLALQVGLRTQRTALLLLTLSMLGGALLLLEFPELLEPMLNRLDKPNVARGYGRILDHPWLLLFGAGEHRSSSFETFRGHEIHSTFGTVLFSYGLVGSALFAGIIAQPVLARGFLFSLPLLPPFVYGLTHNTMRQTDVWVLLAMLMMRVVVEGRNEQQDRLALARAQLPVPRLLPPPATPAGG